MVEAQHVVSTMTLVETLEEQELLEQVLDDAKPAVPPDCRGLHYLLSTPFRYHAIYPHGSRFRRAGHTSGVFYASHKPATAVAEMAFRRLLFYAESPATPWPSSAGEYTAFAARFAARAGLDLAQPPLNRDAARWQDPVDYTSCQELADRARAAGVQALRYHSARAEGLNVALLTCAAFASREPLERRRWRIHLGASGVRAICDFPEERLAFGPTAFARDPRIAGIEWDR